ncbi:hypothetical protein PHYPSEUDO_007774 [Phytophthora pseudosyringae]|uniref:Uncharacterized protein n=1 Tax=Phytophthora pseudosyringae TaxID=221518 RepID=A0A8T1VIT3_9STRA|nr:hypothetical protein PHYPSEUDO_007774 [Phytophthora pseudosyringae]
MSPTSATSVASSRSEIPRRDGIPTPELSEAGRSAASNPHSKGDAAEKPGKHNHGANDEEQDNSAVDDEPSQRSQGAVSAEPGTASARLREEPIKSSKGPVASTGEVSPMGTDIVAGAEDAGPRHNKVSGDVSYATPPNSGTAACPRTSVGWLLVYGVCWFYKNHGSAWWKSQHNQKNLVMTGFSGTTINGYTRNDKMSTRCLAYQHTREQKMPNGVQAQLRVDTVVSAAQSWMLICAGLPRWRAILFMQWWLLDKSDEWVSPLTESFIQHFAASEEKQEAKLTQHK